MNTPLVSVICLCYNHERYVEEAIQSVLHQTYSNVQLVVVDDHSTDNSVEVIKKNMPQHALPEFLPLSANLGNCRAFNKGLEKSRGDFIIDLACDDVLMPDRIEKGVQSLQSADDKVGVNFTDAQLIDEQGSSLGYHSDRFPHRLVPQGDIYKEILSHYFINSPTMMMRRAVFEKLGGYDESLAYEDFDFWVRSSRYFNYCYTPLPLIKRRVLNSSLGKKQYRIGSGQLRSTLKVCEKAIELNKTAEEHQLLKKRISYEMRKALVAGKFGIAADYLKLRRRIP